MKLSNGIPFKITGVMPREVNLDAMNKKEFDKEMERRYKEAISEDGIEEKELLKKYKKSKNNHK